MSAVVDFFVHLWSIPHNFSANRSRNFLDAYPDYPMYATVLYLVVVFYLPPILKKRNLYFDLKYPVALWNFALSAVSFVGAFYADRLVYDFVFHDRGFHKTCCEVLQFPDGSQFGVNIRNLVGKHGGGEEGALAGAAAAPAGHVGGTGDAMRDKSLYGPPAFFIAVFMYLKTPELLDTVFLILQGKPVSFLHWFHHILTSVYCWHASYALTPSGLFFAAMNFSVHAVMYFYFGLVTLGYRKSIRPFAPVITLLQVTQMFAGMGITCYAYLQYWLGPQHEGELFYTAAKALFSAVHYVSAQVTSVLRTGSPLPHAQVPAYRMEDHFVGCDTDRTNLRMAVMMYGSYCVLFGVLFKELYLDKRANEKSLVLVRKQVLVDDAAEEGSASSQRTKPAKEASAIRTGKMRTVG